ncbi:LysR substrate-binding domain-containing protein [Chitinimonas koreensis]|uniref:LysR substrate-binding domain-containing protein n=1 Tax=Chitinimonas koreensis TaxID=356302 RepID=UPI00049061B4|nr:LysR substrate-binding domain-containing protein [Chitinimonas koreensis]
MLSVLLSSFYEVARQCSVTAAAKRLGISQPTLTGRIRQLEEQYGIELFYRRGSRLELTDVGARLMPLAQGMLREAAEADFLLRSAGGLSGLGGGRLRLGATGPYYILPAMAAFRQAYPRIALSLDIGNSREVIEALCDCRVDLAVSSHALDDERLCRRTIARSPLVLVLRADHPLAGRTVVELADLAGLPLLLREEGSMTRQLTEQALAAAGVCPVQAMVLGSREAIHEAIRLGLGCSLLPAGEVPRHPELAQRPFAAGAPTMPEYLYTLRERTGAPLIAAFAAHVATLAD